MTGNEGKVVAKDEVVLLRMGGGRGWGGVGRGGSGRQTQAPSELGFPLTPTWVVPSPSHLGVTLLSWIPLSTPECLSQHSTQLRLSPWFRLGSSSPGLSLSEKAPRSLQWGFGVERAWGQLAEALRKVLAGGRMKQGPHKEGRPILALLASCPLAAL